MKITVKVHGTLMKYIADYDHEKGLDLEFPDNTDASELVNYLGIPKSSVGMVSVNGHQVKSENPASAWCPSTGTRSNPTASCRTVRSSKYSSQFSEDDSGWCYRGDSFNN